MSDEPEPTVEDDWWFRAACRGRSLLFYGADSFSIELACSICRNECPVRQECLDETRYIEHRGAVRFGVRGGYTAAERMDWDRDTPR